MYLYVNCCRGFYLLYMETENFFILALFARFSLFLTPFLIFLSVFQTFPAYCQAFPAFRLSMPLLPFYFFSPAEIFFRSAAFLPFDLRKLICERYYFVRLNKSFSAEKSFFSQYPPKIIGVPTASLSARTAICRLIFRPLSITPPFNRGE